MTTTAAETAAFIPEQGLRGPLQQSPSSTTTDAGNPSTSASSPSACSADARFSCNICFDAVTEPVVTQCGHLYCWPCLYRWLAPGMKPQERASLGMPVPVHHPYSLVPPLDESRRVCPVCKSPCSVPNVVPIYVDNNNNSNSINSDPLRRNSGNPEEEEEKKESLEEEAVDRSLGEDHSEVNMGLDIDGDLQDDHDGVPLPAVSATTSAGSASEGLRRRRPPNTPIVAVAEAEPSSSSSSSSTSFNNSTADTTQAPRRPVPVRETAPPSSEENNSTAIVPRAHSPPRNSHHHAARASLSYGLVLAMHQTLLNATSGSSGQRSNNNHHQSSNNSQGNNNNNNSNANDDDPSAEAIPSLHYPEQNQQRTNNPASPSSSMSGGSSVLNADAMSMMENDPASTEFLSRLLLGLSLFVLFCLLSF